MFFKRNRDFGSSMEYVEADAPLAWRPSFPRSPIPLPGHVVLRSRDGEVAAMSRPGFALPTDRFVQVDQRRRHLSFAPQRIPTAEGQDVTLTFVLTVRVSDPVAFLTAADEPDREVYLAAQIALRELVSTKPLAEFIGQRIDLSPVAEAAREAGEAVGVEVLGDVHLKDLSLPHGVAEALSQAEVDKLTAASELERARTEVKITRARMGTAKVLEQNPLLAKIRLLEALPPGTTLELRDRSLEPQDQPREPRDRGELDS